MTGLGRTTRAPRRRVVRYEAAVARWRGAREVGVGGKLCPHHPFGRAAGVSTKQGSVCSPYVEWRGVGDAHRQTSLPTTIDPHTQSTEAHPRVLAHRQAALRRRSPTTAHRNAATPHTAQHFNYRAI